MFKKLILPIVVVFFILVLVSCTPNIPDISDTIEEINRIDDKLEQIDTEIEDLETELENKE
jgi:cell division protein FtsL